MSTSGPENIASPASHYSTMKKSNS
ncbi:hypothetical protein Gpo141_00012326, partial [Globisporangium polare]